MELPRLVLFDIGSTLWSSPAEDPGALNYCYGRGRRILLDAMGEAPPVEDLIEAVEGYFAEWEDIWRSESSRVEQAPTSEFVAEALARLKLSPPADALAAFTDVILETSVHTARTLPPERGMTEALAAMRAAGLRLACVSNAFMGAATLHQIMVERGLGEHIEFTLSSCELGIRKPHPAIYQAAIERGGVRGEEAMFVGDRLDADVEGPAALGIRTVLTHQYRQEDPSNARVQPELVIAHLRDLAAYLVPDRALDSVQP